MGQRIPPITRTTYTYNPACHCAWCRNQGHIPPDSADAGHGYGYEQPHNPPTTIRFMGTNTKPAPPETA